MSLWEKIEGKMSQETFFGIIAEKSLVSFAIMAAAGFVAFLILPWLAGVIIGVFTAGKAGASLIPPEIGLAFWITYLGIIYIFEAWKDSTLGGRVTRFIQYSLIAVAYFVIMLLGGELLAFGLMIFGVLAVVVFVAGQLLLTGIFTHRDLKKWVEEEEKKEFAAQLQQQLDQTTPHE